MTCGHVLSPSADGGPHIENFKILSHRLQWNYDIVWGIFLALIGIVGGHRVLLDKQFLIDYPNTSPFTPVPKSAGP